MFRRTHHVSGSRSAVLPLLLLLALLSVGCSHTVAAVSPSPSVVVVGRGKYAVDVTKVADEFEFSKGPFSVTIAEVQESVRNGFKNAAGSSFVEQRDADVVLIFDDLDVSIDAGRFGVLRVKYRVRWVSSTGEEIASAAGTALPMNPAQTGDGQWEDVLEVMLQEVVAAYAEATKHGRPTGAPPSEQAPPPSQAQDESDTRAL